MSSQSNQENASIKGHDGQHNQVSKTNPYGMQESLNQTGAYTVGFRFDQFGMREPFNQDSQNKNKDQG